LVDNNKKGRHYDGLFCSAAFFKFILFTFEDFACVVDLFTFSSYIGLEQSFKKEKKYMSKIFINKSFRKLFEDKYYEMKKKHLTKDFLDEIHFGGIKVYINQKPQFILDMFVPDDGLKNTVYVGSDF